MGERVRRRADGRDRSAMNWAWWKNIRDDWGVDLAIGAGCALFMALLGPFGSYFNGPLWQRVAFQLACFWPGILIFGALIRVILRWRLKPTTTWLAIGAMIIAVNGPFLIWVSWLGQAMWPIFKILRPFDLYLQNLVTSAPVVIGFTFLIRARLHKRALAREAEAEPPSAFGLLGAAPSAILCLQMEDHYVRVHTAAGSRLVLATLAQAIAALAGADGLQVHRSWWVARKAVVRAIADGRNLRLQLVNGATAPVSRAAVAAVRAKGWMGGEGRS
jgi:LytTr DNA-binding domain